MDAHRTSSLTKMKATLVGHRNHKISYVANCEEEEEEEAFSFFLLLCNQSESKIPNFVVITAFNAFDSIPITISLTSRVTLTQRHLSFFLFSFFFITPQKPLFTITINEITSFISFSLIHIYVFTSFTITVVDIYIKFIQRSD